MEEYNAMRFIQLVSLVRKSTEETFTNFLERLSDRNCKDLVSWVCEHYEMSERVWADIWS